MGKDIGLAHNHLLGLGEEEGRDATKIGRKVLPGRGENVHEPEE
jgi:hypothetical protein